jgi:hypothetical protein
MWPASVVYVWSTDERRKALENDRHTGRVVRRRRRSARR